MSSTNSSTTNNTDNAISLVDDAPAAAVVGAVGPEGDQLTISSLDSSSMASSTGGSATDTEGEEEVIEEGHVESFGAEKLGGSRRGSQLSLGPEEATVEEILGGSETRERAISKLVLFSCVLFTVPLTLMFITYRFIFTGYYHLPHDRAILYAGIVAAAAVYVILALFAWLAYRDENKLAQQMETVGSTEDSKKTD